MFISGHLGTAYLLHRVSGLNLCFVGVATIFPDLVDKGLGLTGLFTTGRHVAHNLFSLALTAGIIGCWWGRWAGTAWSAGYAAHLLVDLPFSWAMPWFFFYNLAAGITLLKWFF